VFAITDFMDGYLTLIAEAFRCKFPDDNRIPVEYRGNEVVVSFCEGEVSVDEKPLTGYALEFANKKINTI
jgi:hypothetical protein